MLNEPVSFVSCAAMVDSSNSAGPLASGQQPPPPVVNMMFSNENLQGQVPQLTTTTDINAKGAFYSNGKCIGLND